MDIFLQQRRVRLGVGEFAAYREGPGPAGESGNFADAARMQLGTQWHETLRAETAGAQPEARFEYAIQQSWLHRGWTFEFQGRADQILFTPDAVRVREIKTVSAPLPQNPDDLRARHPEFFRQVAAYVALLRLASPWGEKDISGEVLLLDIGSGLRQCVPLDDMPERVLARQLDRLLVFLEDRLQSRARLGAIDFKPAFAELRPGQREAQAALSTALETAKQAAFEAPTGFGKTGLLLEAGLARLRGGQFARLIYLTGKSTGQWSVAEQLTRMTHGGVPRFYQMRNRTEHMICSPLHTCTEGARCDGEYAEARWAAANLDIPALFSSGTVALETVKALGERHGLCPYEISRALLPYADIWLCDYNYLFAPGSRSFLNEQFGYAPRDTLLVIDEAHNLPARVADAFSQRITPQALQKLEDVLTLAGAPYAALQSARKLSAFVAQIAPCPRMELAEQYTLEALVEALDTAIALAFGQMELDDLLTRQTDIWETLFAPARWREFFQNARIVLLVWCEHPGTAELTCLDAAQEIAEVVNAFGCTVYSSATLSPAEEFCRKTGAARDHMAWITASAPWHADAFHIAIDARADTRLSQRERHFAKTAGAIADFAQGLAEPVAVFFPSYQYARNIETYLRQTQPFLRIALQPRGLDLPGQTQFLEEALLTAHALFLVLGSGFSESIDLLGGRVKRAFIVGPALPELNPVQRAKADALGDIAPHEAFRRVYQMPAMRKINQALGRLVRAPGQTATIVLHCRRFDEKPYRDLLAVPAADIPVLRTDTQWQEWLEGLKTKNFRG